MGRRSCASCRYYERSSIARMGWCRHPELYAADHNHLVASDDLDCDRGSGDFWESPTSTGELVTSESGAAGRHIISITPAGSPVFAVSGSSGYNDDPPPPVPGGGGGPSWGDGDRDLGYYDDERTWVDWVRIGAPILGILILVGLLWFWISSFLNEDDDPDAAANGTATIGISTIGATEGETPAAGETPSPPSVAPTATTPGDGTTQVAPTSPDAPTEDPGGGDGPTDIYLGATVEVANTDGAGVNVRAEPSTTSDVLSVFLDGTQIQVIDGPTESEGFVWWQINGNEVAAGWVVSDFLVVIE